MTIKGLIFDFDGLLIDTEMPCFSAWVELFSQFGFSFTKPDYQKIIGTNYHVYDPATHLSQLTNGILSPQEISERITTRTRELISSQPLRPGVLDFLYAAQRIGLSMAVASSSKRTWVEGYLDQFAVRHFFSVVAAAEDVLKVKPDAELYQLATRLLKVLPHEVMAFEDSTNGIKAAKAAGIYCVAIPNKITKEMDLSLADRIVDSITEIDLDCLLNS
jgi:HAD superfamily hydrolase (TIGR01509 family)